MVNCCSGGLHLFYSPISAFYALDNNPLGRAFAALEGSETAGREKRPS